MVRMLVKDLENGMRNCRVAILHTTSIINRLKDMKDPDASSKTPSTVRKSPRCQFPSVADMSAAQLSGGGSVLNPVVPGDTVGLMQALRTRLKENRALCHDIRAIGMRAMRWTTVGIVLPD